MEELGIADPYPPHVDPKNDDHRPRPFDNKIVAEHGLAVCSVCGGALPARWVGKDLLKADPETGNIG